MNEKDVLVIGGGPAGYVAAIRASQLGAKALLVEKDELGGTCANKGCVPTKSLLRGVELLELVRESRQYGICTDEIKIDFAKMIAHKNLAVRRVVAGIQTLMKGNVIEIVKGKGRLISATQVEVETENSGRQHFQSKVIILTPGCIPLLPPIPGVEGSGVITTDQVFQLSKVPRNLVIIGGGTSGVEFATIFARIGSVVTIVEMAPHIIPTEDDEIALLLESYLKKIGVQIFNGTTVSQIKDGPEGSKIVTLNTRSGQKEIYSELVLVTAGRRPNTEGLGLQKVGIVTEMGAIAVNKRMETNIPSIYAAGDVTGGILLACVASSEGMAAAENALGKDSVIEYQAVPHCIYSIPEVAAVGMTEREAKEKGYQVKIGKFPMAANTRAVLLGKREGFIKVVTDAGSGEILGVHIIGHLSTEMIIEASLALRTRRTVSDIISTIHAHPTLHEGTREAFLDVRGEAVHIPPQRRKRLD